LNRIFTAAILGLALTGFAAAQQAQDAAPNAAAPQSPAPAQTSPPAQTPITRGPFRISSGRLTAKRISGDAPKYPVAARAAGISGRVVLKAIIGKNGMIEEVRVVSGPRELWKAAVDAVNTWKYEPLVINGEPVEVTTQVTVNFDMNP
jgi:protein TonB